MNSLVEFILAKHNTQPYTDQLSGQITATVNVHGIFWAYKGQPGLLGVATVTADLTRQRISMYPYGPGNTLTFDAAQDAVTITDSNGTIVDSLEHPRRSMAGFQQDTPWSATQMGYFISYATWIYLAEPLLFTLPGVETEELEPWQEDGETWRRLRATFPESIAAHNRVQTYYFDSVTGMQRRMDYDVEVNGSATVAHYTSEHQNFAGRPVPTRRRVLLRDGNGTADHSFAAILLDLENLTLRDHS